MVLRWVYWLGDVPDDRRIVQILGKEEGMEIEREGGRERRRMRR